MAFNGRPLTKRLRRSIGFVLQDDLLYENLTVYETLYYAAMLRLPREMPDADKVARVNAVIAALGIESCRNTIIGTRRCCMLTIKVAPRCLSMRYKFCYGSSLVLCCLGLCMLLRLCTIRGHAGNHTHASKALARYQASQTCSDSCDRVLHAGGHKRKGVSGGERKRVSIGHEMLINPSVLMLDGAPLSRRSYLACACHNPGPGICVTWDVAGVPSVTSSGK